MHGISPRNLVDTQSPAPAIPSANRLMLMGLSVKRYPVCYASHRAIDAVIDLASAAQLTADGVKSVIVGLGAAPAQTLKFSHPRTGLEAKFSLHHNVAAALLDGQVGFAQLTDEYVRRPDVMRLYGRTTMQILSHESPDQPGMAAADWVVIETVDGRRLASGDIRYTRGHAKLPLSDAALDEKFLACARHGQVAGGAKMLGTLRRMDTLRHTRELNL